MIKTKEDAKRVLNNVDPEKVFYVCDGSILHNIKNLNTILKYMHPDAYAHHANPEKNDFAKWLGEVMGDETLAKNIMHKSKEEAQKVVERRMVFLEKKAQVKTKKSTTKKVVKKRTTKKK